MLQLLTQHLKLGWIHAITKPAAPSNLQNHLVYLKHALVVHFMTLYCAPMLLSEL